MNYLNFKSASNGNSIQMTCLEPIAFSNVPFTVNGLDIQDDWYSLIKKHYYIFCVDVSVIKP